LIQQALSRASKKKNVQASFFLYKEASVADPDPADMDPDPAFRINTDSTV
jgi:hypothetical protein